MSETGDAAIGDASSGQGGRVRYVLAAVFDIDFLSGERDDVAAHFTAAVEEAVSSYTRRNVGATEVVSVTVGRALA